MEIKERGQVEILSELLNEVKKKLIFDLVQLKESKIMFINNKNPEIDHLMNQKKVEINTEKKIIRSIRLDIRSIEKGKKVYDLNTPEKIVDVRPPSLEMQGKKPMPPTNSELKKEVIKPKEETKVKA